MRIVLAAVLALAAGCGDAPLGCSDDDQVAAEAAFRRMVREDVAGGFRGLEARADSALARTSVSIEIDPDFDTWHARQRALRCAASMDAKIYRLRVSEVIAHRESLPVRLPEATDPTAGPWR